ncbi:MAG: hypothetical protein DRJ52_10785 [Thermoprotei archaeon]|nr:MAG: hypothetical protein DRJ52_10785 [Thermoprotei archaeon]
MVEEGRASIYILKARDELQAAKILHAAGLSQYSLVHLKRALFNVLRSLAEVLGESPPLDIKAGLEELGGVIKEELGEDWLREVLERLFELEKGGEEYMDYWCGKILDIAVLAEKKAYEKGLDLSREVFHLRSEGVELRASTLTAIFREALLSLGVALKRDPVKILLIGAAIICSAAIFSDYVLAFPQAFKLYEYSLYLILASVVGRGIQLIIEKARSRKGAPAGI